MGTKVNAVKQESEQLTKMVAESCHRANKQWLNFEQCNALLVDCHEELMNRLNVLIQQGKQALDVYALADGDQEAVSCLKLHADLRAKAVESLGEYEKEIKLLKAYGERIQTLLVRVSDLIGDRLIGTRSAKSLPMLNECKKIFVGMADDIGKLVTTSKNMPKLHLDF
jgi:hypothetical protein